MEQIKPDPDAIESQDQNVPKLDQINVQNSNSFQNVSPLSSQPHPLDHMIRIKPDPDAMDNHNDQTSHNQILKECSHSNFTQSSASKQDAVKSSNQRNASFSMTQIKSDPDLVERQKLSILLSSIVNDSGGNSRNFHNIKDMISSLDIPSDQNVKDLAIGDVVNVQLKSEESQELKFLLINKNGMEELLAEKNILVSVQNVSSETKYVGEVQISSFYKVAIMGVGESVYGTFNPDFSMDSSIKLGALSTHEAAHISGLLKGLKVCSENNVIESDNEAEIQYAKAVEKFQNKNYLSAFDAISKCIQCKRGKIIKAFELRAQILRIVANNKYCSLLKQAAFDYISIYRLDKNSKTAKEGFEFLSTLSSKRALKKKEKMQVANCSGNGK